MSSVHFGRKPNRKRVCGSLNRTSRNHYGSEPNRTGTGQNHAFIQFKGYTGLAAIQGNSTIAVSENFNYTLNELKTH